MKQKIILICGVFCLSIFTGCKKDETPPVPVPAPQDTTQRTVLMYLFQDTDLSEELTDNINELEKGWDSTTNGTMLVYVDASTRMTQFDGQPVLLEIKHDTTNLIVSKIVKVYPDADATSTEVFNQVQADVIDMYPAKSYGLILSGHGNGFFVKDPGTKGLSGSDRWSNNFLDVDVIAANLPVYYDFIMFDACLMGETSTLYQLRNVTDFVVASVELSPGDGFAYRSDLKALFTQPKADLSTFVRSTARYFKNTTQGRSSIDTADYMTIGVYRMAAMEQLAAVTKKAVTKLNFSYEQLRQSFKTIRKNPEYKISNSMYYPRDTKYSTNPMYYDMWLLKQLLDDMEEDALVKKLDSAIFNVVMQRQFAVSDIFEDKNPEYTKKTANMSIFIPNKLDKDISGQSDAFYNRFEWSAASGFTDQWE